MPVRCSLEYLDLLSQYLSNLYKNTFSIMKRHHLNNKQKLRAMGMAEGGSSQREVTRQIDTSVSVNSRLWRRYN